MPPARGARAVPNTVRERLATSELSARRPRRRRDPNTDYSPARGVAATLVPKNDPVPARDENVTGAAFPRRLTGLRYVNSPAACALGTTMNARPVVVCSSRVCLRAASSRSRPRGRAPFWLIFTKLDCWCRRLEVRRKMRPNGQDERSAARATDFEGSKMNVGSGPRTFRARSTFSSRAICSREYPSSWELMHLALPEVPRMREPTLLLNKLLLTLVDGISSSGAVVRRLRVGGEMLPFSPLSRVPLRSVPVALVSQPPARLVPVVPAAMFRPPLPARARARGGLRVCAFRPRVESKAPGIRSRVVAARAAALT